MLSIKRCREILGPGCNLSDEELELLREQLYVIAEMALDAYHEAQDADGMDEVTPKNRTEVH